MQHCRAMLGKVKRIRNRCKIIKGLEKKYDVDATGKGLVRGWVYSHGLTVTCSI